MSDIGAYSLRLALLIAGAGFAAAIYAGGIFEALLRFGVFSRVARSRLLAGKSHPP